MGDGVLKIWDHANNGQCRQVCKVPPSEGNEDAKAGGVTRLRWHPTLPFVFTACSDGTVRVWDARNGTIVHTLTGHADMINAIDCNFVSNSGVSLIVSGSDDNTVRLFEVDVAASS